MLATTLGLTIRQPISSMAKMRGIPMMTTTKSVLCQKYGDDFHPEMAMPTTTMTRKASPM